jgi:hypothetical protein
MEDFIFVHLLGLGATMPEHAVELGRPLKFSSIDQRAPIAVAMHFFLNGAVFASFMPRLPEIRERTGVTTGGLGALLSIAGVHWDRWELFWSVPQSDDLAPGT